jgi:hypothetical protein
MSISPHHSQSTDLFCAQKPTIEPCEPSSDFKYCVHFSSHIHVLFSSLTPPSCFHHFKILAEEYRLSTWWWRWCSCRWGETMSLNCGHQRACCSHPRLYVSMENHCGMIHPSNGATAQIRPWPPLLRFRNNNVLRCEVVSLTTNPC